MKYVLIWCDRLGVFALHGPAVSSRMFSENELRSEFDGNSVLNQWADFAKAHANVGCEYEMLPD